MFKSTKKNRTAMQPEFSEMLKILNSSHNVAEFCLQCPMYGILVDNKTVE